MERPSVPFRRETEIQTKQPLLGVASFFHVPWASAVELIPKHTIAQQMQIVDEQIKLARLRCNLTLRKWP